MSCLGCLSVDYLKLQDVLGGLSFSQVIWTLKMSLIGCLIWLTCTLKNSWMGCPCLAYLDSQFVLEGLS